MQKRNKITATGIIDQNGRLQMYMPAVRSFLEDNKGQRVFLTFQVAPTATSEAMKAYYYKCVVPEMARAMYEQGERRTEQDTDKWLRELSPVCHDEDINTDTGEWRDRLKEITELSNSELQEHLEFVRQFAAEEYQIVINDPKSL